MRSFTKGPNNKPGTQWPHQIQKCTGITVVIIGRKKSVNPKLRWWWWLPKDHLRTGGLLEHAQRRDRAGNHTNHIPQAEVPSVALRKLRKKKDWAQQQRDTKHPGRADRLTNGA